MESENNNKKSPDLLELERINKQLKAELTQVRSEKEKFHASIRRLMLAMEATSDGIWDFDFVSNKAFFSAAWAEMLGYAPNELPPSPKTLEELMHPDDVPKYRQQLERHFQNSAVEFRCQYRLKTKQGQWIWILSRGKVVEQDESNKPLRMVGTHTDISHLKKIEQDLRESQERFSVLIASCPDAIAIAEEHGNLVYWNKAAENLTGYPANELLGQPFFCLLPSWLRRELEDTPQTKLREKVSANPSMLREGIIIAKDGHEVPVELSVATWSIQGQTFYSAVMRDISQRRSMEQELLRIRHKLEQKVEAQTQEIQQSRDFLENVFQTAGDAVIVTDASGIILRINRKAEQLFGYAEQELQGKHCSVLGKNPGYRDKSIHNSAELLKAGFLENLRLECRKKDGTVFPAESNIALLRSETGTITVVVASLRDITEREKIETALRQSQKRYYDLFNELTDAAFVADAATGILIDVNHAAEQLMQCSREEIIGTHFSTLHPPKRSEYYKSLFAQCSTQHTTRNIDCEVQTRSGNIIPVTINTSTFEHNGDRLIIGLFRDVSEQKQAENQLQIVYFFLNNASEAIICVDKNAQIVFANSEALKVFGTITKNSDPLSLYDLVKSSIRRPWQEYWDENKKKKNIVFDIPVQTSSGQTVQLQFLHNFFEFKGEEYLCAFVRNITDLKNTQETLMREIEERKIIEQQLSAREAELASKTHELEEVNSALKILLQRTEESKKEVEEKIMFNMQELVIPYIEKMKEIITSDRQKTYLNIIESNIMNIVSPFGKKLSVQNAKLTPSEIHIANLIKNGCSTKKIADMMGLSNRTVDFHRKNIRKKLGITDRKTNLRSVLLSME